MNLKTSNIKRLPEKEVWNIDSKRTTPNASNYWIKSTDAETKGKL